MSRALINFDRNRYSVMAKAVRRAVQVRAYADRLIVRCDGEVVADHSRFFGRDQTIYDPWHYLPVLVTKPGALRNGAPFQGWELPPALSRLRRKLGAGDDADRRFVRVLATVLDDGLEAVEAAVREALLEEPARSRCCCTARWPRTSAMADPTQARPRSSRPRGLPMRMISSRRWRAE